MYEHSEIELLHQSQIEDFGKLVKLKLAEDTDVGLKAVLERGLEVHTWYDTYKTLSNEKEIAEKIESKLYRQEKRRIKRKQKLRKKRLDMIEQSL